MVTIKEIRRRAAAAGVTMKSTSKTDLVRAIQAAEHNPQCFQTNRRQCAESSCCWMSDCVAAGCL